MPEKPPPDELAPRRKRGAKPGGRRGASTGPTSGQKMVVARQRQADAIQLRIGGATLQQIATQLGYAGPTGAHAAVMAGMRDILPETKRAEYRQMELARLDSLMLAHWTEARGSGEDFPQHARIVLQCIGMRMKLLGLEAPTQVSVAVREGELVEVDIFKQLNAETLAALVPFQEEMVRQSELRAGAIDAEPDAV